MAATTPRSDRHRAYALLGIARRALGWDDDAPEYRGLLAAHGAREHRGRPSAATMSYAQIAAALAAMEAAGWRRTDLASSIIHRCHPARRAQWRKVCALWCALAESGAVRDRRESAMLAWCRRLVAEDRLEWAGARSLSTCIDSLRDWQARVGGAGA